MTDVPIGDGLQPVVASEPSLRRVMGPWLLLLFIVGDILGTGIYALTGQVAKQVGGAVWLPFLLAFVVALIQPKVSKLPGPQWLALRVTDN